MRVLAIGECMAELAALQTPGNFRQGFAGDTFNTAWYLAQLLPEADIGYFTAVGTDPISAQMRAFIRGSGIDDSLIREVPGATIGLYMVALDKGERSFSYWRGQSAARRLADDEETLARAMAGADLIYLSGISLAILDPAGRDRVLKTLSAARAGGARIAFDPNLRPQLWDTSADMTRTVMAAAKLCDIALPSFEDEARWFSDDTPEATRLRYARAGACQVVVKNGGGAILWQDGTASGACDVETVPDPVDTTAAGDSLNAGVLAHLATGGALIDGLALGARLARHVVRHRGALVPCPSDLAPVQA